MWGDDKERYIWEVLGSGRVTVGKGSLVRAREVGLF